MKRCIKCDKAISWNGGLDWDPSMCSRCGLFDKGEKAAEARIVKRLRERAAAYKADGSGSKHSEITMHWHYLGHAY